MRQSSVKLSFTYLTKACIVMLMIHPGIISLFFFSETDTIWSWFKTISHKNIKAMGCLVTGIFKATANVETPKILNVF